MTSKNAIILAAGKGTRMKSKRAKVLHEVCGRPMVAQVLHQLTAAGIARPVVVVGHQAATVKAALGDQVDYALQTEQLGTGHAVMQTTDWLADRDGVTLVVSGDTPSLRPRPFRP